VISYLGGSGPKVARFWRMQSVGDEAGKPMDDIKAVEWLPLAAAIDRLSLSHEQSFLRGVGRQALKRTIKKARPTRPQDAALPPGVAVPASTTLPRRDVPPPVTSSDAGAALGTKSQPRWHTLARLTKRWQSAIGRTRRTG
jgi:8-oxo-dGTP diphosphatase